MKERPILFNGDMVRAILDGRKTQTRRVVKPGAGQKWLTNNTIQAVRRFAPSKDNWWTMAVGEPSRMVHCGLEMDGGHIGSVQCPYGQTGDRLWVREAWAAFDLDWRYIPRPADLRDGPWPNIEYAATAVGWENPRWRPSIHMPRWASRITLEITDVRVERLMDISEDDAKAEGAKAYDPSAYFTSAQMNGGREEFEYRSGFADLWNSVYGNWSANPWVWVIEFKQLKETK